MLPDWGDPTFGMARQYPAPPGVIVTAGSPAQMRVAGRLVSAMPVDAGAYPAGTQVKPVQLGAEWFFLPSASKYPASYIEPLSAWADRSREALFLKYVLEQSNCAQLRVYTRGRVEAVANEYQLTVTCWDGVTRTLPVDYMGVATTGAFAPGDKCLIYDSGNFKMVLGLAGTLPDQSQIFVQTYENQNIPWSGTGRTINFIFSSIYNETTIRTDTGETYSYSGNVIKDITYSLPDYPDEPSLNSPELGFTINGVFWPAQYFPAVWGSFASVSASLDHRVRHGSPIVMEVTGLPPDACIYWGFGIGSYGLFSRV